MSDNIVTIKDLVKIYKTDSEELTILNGVNLSIQAGTSNVVVGQSGSGKSTFLNIIGGLDSATSGEVIAGPYNVTALTENQLAEYRSKYLGLIFQFHYLLKDFTALENVFLPCYMAGTPKKEAMERALQLLNDVGLSSRTDHLPSQLSGGERQRVAVARSLVNDPQIILADEPTGNLDPANAQLIGDILFSMAEKYAKTLILVTHDMELASKGQNRLSIVNGNLV